MSNDEDRVSFNLMDRPWILVIMKNGERRELSIREVFAQADAIRSIDGDIPLQRFALSRLLIAVLYGAFGHSFTADEWRYMLEAGASDAEIQQQLQAYCERWCDRFDLFDPARPFYQVAGLHTAKHEIFGLERLTLDVPSGEPFFTTRIGEGLSSVDAAEAARWLVTVQAYDPSGIKSGAVGDPRVKGGRGYPIGTAWTGNLGGYLVEGSNLWRTLMLNFVSDQVFTAAESAVRWDDDAPIWEREPVDPAPCPGLDQPADRTGDTSFFHGPATLMTWQSRRMLLAHQGETVTGVLVCNGDRLKPQNAQHYETMSAWRRIDSLKKGRKQTLVYMPNKHEFGRALWRGLPTLTVGMRQDASDGPANQLRPLTLDWLSNVYATHKEPIRLHAFGVQYGPSVKESTRIDCDIDDVLDLDLTVLASQNPQLGQMLEQAVNDTDKGVRALRDFAVNIALAAEQVKIDKESSGENRWQRVQKLVWKNNSDKKKGGLAENIASRAERLGYATFDRAFRQWVRGIDADCDLSALYAEWQRKAMQLLQSAGTQLIEQAPPRAFAEKDIVVDLEHNKTEPYSVALAAIWYYSDLKRIFPSEEGQ